MLKKHIGIGISLTDEVKQSLHDNFIKALKKIPKCSIIDATLYLTQIHQTVAGIFNYSSSAAIDRPFALMAVHPNIDTSLLDPYKMFCRIYIKHVKETYGISFKEFMDTPFHRLNPLLEVAEEEIININKELKSLKEALENNNKEKDKQQKKNTRNR